jgi:hypothetical protein
VGVGVGVSVGVGVGVSVGVGLRVSVGVSVGDSESPCRFEFPRESSVEVGVEVSLGPLRIGDVAVSVCGDREVGTLGDEGGPVGAGGHESDVGGMDSVVVRTGVPPYPNVGVESNGVVSFSSLVDGPSVVQPAIPTTAAPTSWRYPRRCSPGRFDRPSCTLLKVSVSWRSSGGFSASSVMDVPPCRRPLGAVDCCQSIGLEHE